MCSRLICLRSPAEGGILESPGLRSQGRNALLNSSIWGCMSYIMSSIERLLEPHSAETPECRCGNPMTIEAFTAVPGRADCHVRIFKCSSCDHELRLTVWSADASDPASWAKTT